MKVNIFSETELLNMPGEGTHTSFVSCVELLHQKNDVEVFVNSKQKCDVIHSHTYGPFYFWKGRKYKGNRVYTAHVIPDSTKGTFPGWRVLMPVFKWYMKRVYSYADVCIAISPMVEDAIKDLGVKSKIVRVNNPILLDTWKRNEEIRVKGRSILELKEDDFCVLGVGQLENRKGVLDFIEIAKSIPEIEFRWIGGRPFGRYTDGFVAINEAIDSAPNNIKFMGMYPLDVMPTLYAGGDLFIFTSYQENSPLAPVEAAASGMPVIYRDIEEYVKLYTNEYLKSKNNSEFINEISKMKSDKNYYERGVEISQQLITQFDKNIIRAQLMGIYDELNINSIKKKEAVAKKTKSKKFIFF
jgi:1,2-diacylglycerol-3-alpha-glucose alpha-1,2-galactosyltransferase